VRSRGRRRPGLGNAPGAQIANAAQQDGSEDDEQNNAPTSQIGLPMQVQDALPLWAWMADL